LSKRCCRIMTRSPMAFCSMKQTRMPPPNNPLGLWASGDMMAQRILPDV
jgi:hypothetical protein